MSQRTPPLNSPSRYAHPPTLPGSHATAGTAPIPTPSPLTLLQLAHAWGTQLLERHDGSTQCPAVFIGHSTCATADMVLGALQAGFNAAGVDVVLGGTLPTPAVAFITRARGFQGGVAIAGSGQPFAENGLRLLTERGERLPAAQETALAQRLRVGTTVLNAPRLGHTWDLPSASRLYTDSGLHRLGSCLDLQGLSLVLSNPHSAAHPLARSLLERLGARVCASEPLAEGGNATSESRTAGCDHLSQAVRAQHADLGIALSDDGQRVVVADARGRVFGGDELLYLLAMDAQQRGAGPGGVVGTATSNLGLELALARQGLCFARAAPGERQMLHTLRQRGWTLGACPGGQLVNLALHPGSDGLLAALQVLAVLQRTHQDLAQRCSDLQLYAQCQIHVAVPSDSDWQHNARLQGCRERAEHGLGGQGRVLLHACEHEPLLRVMVECPDARRAAAVAMELASTMGHAAPPRSSEPVTV